MKIMRVYRTWILGAWLILCSCSTTRSVPNTTSLPEPIVQCRKAVIQASEFLIDFADPFSSDTVLDRKDTGHWTEDKIQSELRSDLDLLTMEWFVVQSHAYQMLDSPELIFGKNELLSTFDRCEKLGARKADVDELRSKVAAASRIVLENTDPGDVKKALEELWYSILSHFNHST